jgi:hypothetical protein
MRRASAVTSGFPVQSGKQFLIVGGHGEAAKT